MDEFVSSTLFGYPVERIERIISFICWRGENNGGDGGGDN
jgi:hypothetical protein